MVLIRVPKKGELMKLAIGLVVALLAPALAAQQPDSPADQYKALLREHQTAVDAYFKAIRQAKTDQERGEAYKLYPEPAKFAARFLDLAEKHPKDPVAVDSLLWIVTNTRGLGSDKSRNRALELLRDHVTSEKLGRFCQGAGYSLGKGEETLLRLIADKSPHAAVQGQALLALGKMLTRLQEAVERAKAQPDTVKFLERQYGAEGAKEILARDPKELAKEAEQLLERVSTKFADVKADGRGTLGAAAKAELFSLRHLAIGKVVPDFEGPDQDGKTFKLSDYRGKVVVLDFWQQH